MTKEQIAKYWKDVEELFENSAEDDEIYMFVLHTLGKRHGLEKVEAVLESLEVQECMISLSHAIWKQLEWPEA